MTGTELQQLLDAHCQDMRADMPGFLFYGILSCTDGTILSKASANESTSKIIEEGDKANVGISRALLYKCKAEFGTMLDDFF